MYRIIYIWLMRLRRNRVPEKNHQINLIMLYLCSKLLGASQMSGKIFMDGQVGDFLDQPASSSGCIEIIFAENAPIGNTEILH